MSNSSTQIRDIIIGLVLIIVGGATLLHTLNIFVFDESRTLLAGVYGLLILGGVLFIAFLFRPRSLWVMVLALCMFFLAAVTYVLNFQRGAEELIPTSLFLITALAFFAYFVIRPSQWWALLVGWIGLGLAGTVFTSMADVQLPYLSQISSRDLPALVLLTSVFLGFFFTWVIKPRERWWALLTAGMIAAVESVIVTVSIAPQSTLAPVMLFLVAGVTFLLLWMLKTEENNLSWSLYPAIVLITFSAFLFLVTFWMQNSQLVLSLIFLLLGTLFLLNYFRSFFTKEKAKAPIMPSAMSDEGPAGGKTPEEKRDIFKREPAFTKPVESEEAEALEVDEEPEKEATLEEIAEDKPEEEEALKPPLDYPFDAPEEGDYFAKKDEEFDDKKSED
jgi:hypothetical protein